MSDYKKPTIRKRKTTNSLPLPIGTINSIKNKSIINSTHGDNTTENSLLKSRKRKREQFFNDTERSPPVNILNENLNKSLESYNHFVESNENSTVENLNAQKSESLEVENKLNPSLSIENLIDNSLASKYSTTILAIRRLSLLTQHPHKKPAIVPSNLLYTFPNRSSIDKDLDHMRADGVILLIQIKETNIFGIDPMVIVFSKEWEDALNIQLKLYIEGKKKTVQNFSTENSFFLRNKLGNSQVDYDIKYSQILKKFIKFVLHEITDNYILESDLKNVIGADDDDTVMLVRIGAIGNRDLESYNISCPHLGWFFTELKKGRRELLLMLKNAPFKEMTREKLLSRTFRNTELKKEFLLRDCVAQNYAKERELPDGTEMYSVTFEGFRFLKYFE